MLHNMLSPYWPRDKQKTHVITNVHISQYHIHYTVGGKYTYHPHIMAAGSTEFDARFLKENWELFIDDCVIRHMPVVYWF